MISHEHKCIFVHIPKCGGTSIEDIIWPMPRKESDLWMGFTNKYENKYQTGGLQHLKGYQIRQEVGKDIYNSYYKFSFVRNPWDKAISQFSYIKGRNDLLEFLGMKTNDSFKKYLELIQQKNHIQWDKQYKFVMDDNGEIIVDFLGKLETFQKDVPTLLGKLNLDINNIPHSKKSKRKSYCEYYDDESKELIQTMYKIDIETFNYTFD